MYSRRLSLIAAALFASFILSGSRANDRTASPRDRATMQDAQFVALQKKPRKFRGRLPAYWGRIGLSTEQRKKIYGVQLSYRPKIQMLQKQLEELRDKQAKEMEAVLKPEQKKKLADLLEAARKKRAARTKKRSRKSTGAKATDK